MMVITSTDQGDTDDALASDRPVPGVLDRHHVRMESLSDRLTMLSVPRPIDKPDAAAAGTTEGGPEGGTSLVEKIPPEVLEMIFSYLDDISLYAVGQTCSRWRLIVRKRKEFCWKSYTAMRWPLFKPISKVHEWFETYSK